MNISFEWLVPSRLNDAARYLEVKHQVLEVLTRGYSTNAFPHSLHEHRMKNEIQHLCLVTEDVCSSRIIACSYVRVDGKRGATAVLPEYRSHGIGMALVAETLRRIPRQFAEVAARNVVQLDLLERNGFSPVASIDGVRRVLGDLAQYIKSYKTEKRWVVYLRDSRDNPGLCHEFVLLCH
jgi:GNAT superfamily N-acetyltransferase